MKKIITIISFLSLLFSQYNIEGRWHLVGYEDAVMYQFVDTEPFAEAGYRYTIYSIDGTFGGLEDAGGSPNPYHIVDDTMTIDLFFGHMPSYQIDYLCDGQVLELKHIPSGIPHDTLFREGYNYIDSSCEESLESCCDEENAAIDNCPGVGCYIPQCSEDCEWEPMQCWGSTGYCWCVDQYGDEIEGTSIPSWQGLPECGEIEYILGDINEDTLINVQDIIVILNLVLNNQYNSLGDINLDSELDVLDIVTLVGIILNR